MLSHLSIFPATRAQIVESRQRSYPEWGKNMTPETYAERDNLVDRSAVAAERRFTTWVLAPRDDPETLGFMCACETFRREVFISRGEEAVGYGIASVFSPPDNRGKGYAKHMMRLLHWVLAKPEAVPSTFPTEWGVPPLRFEGFGNASVSVLYSDVGPNFYAACDFLPNSRDGWQVAPRAVTGWKTRDAPSPTQEGRWLDEYEVESFWEKDSEIIRQEMTDFRDAAFTFTPRNGLGAFHQLRVRKFVKERGPNPAFYGVALQGLVYASWSFDYPSSRKLVVTRLRATSALFKELIYLIMAYCKQHGLEEIEVWNLPEELVQEANSMDATTNDMKDHLPSVKWYSAGQVEWVNNEKFCWC